MNSIYPLADYEPEVERRHGEMINAQNSILTTQCLDDKKSDASLLLRLLNFFFILIPFIRR